MKKSLLIASLVVAVASSVLLCNCAAGPKTIAQKFARLALVYVNVAPQEVRGKTFVFNYQSATNREKNEATGKWGAWKPSQEGSVNWDFFADLSFTHIDAKGRTAVQGFKGDYVFYTKTSGSTAEIRLDCSDGSGVIYVLKFTTPTSGTASETGTDEEGAPYYETNNITFSIK